MFEVRQQIVPDTRSSYTEGSVAEVGPYSSFPGRVSEKATELGWHTCIL